LPHRLADTFQPVEGAHRRQYVGRVGTLAPASFEQTDGFEAGYHSVKQLHLRSTLHESRAKLTQYRGIKTRISEFKTECVLPVNPTAHGGGGLFVREAFGELEDQDECQSPGCFGRLLACRKEGGKILVGIKDTQFITHDHIAIAMRKGSTGSCGGRFRDRRNGLWVE
jgi:hypothetical protein